MNKDYTLDYCRAIANSPDSDYITSYIELPHIYDGWSVAVMADGTLRNRWPPDDRRHKPTQDWIEGSGDGG